MSNLIQNFRLEMLSKDEMRNVVGGVAPDVRVICDSCDKDNVCLPGLEATCPWDTPEDCNGRPAGADGYTLQNCRIA